MSKLSQPTAPLLNHVLLEREIAVGILAVNLAYFVAQEATSNRFQDSLVLVVRMTYLIIMTCGVMTDTAMTLTSNKTLELANILLLW